MNKVTFKCNAVSYVEYLVLLQMPKFEIFIDANKNPLKNNYI